MWKTIGKAALCVAAICAALVACSIQSDRAGDMRAEERAAIAHRYAIAGRIEKLEKRIEALEATQPK